MSIYKQFAVTVLCWAFSLSDEHKVAVNPSAVNLEEAWNRRDGKDRFGQPIRTPALAEDVKGDINF